MSFLYKTVNTVRSGLNLCVKRNQFFRNQLQPIACMDRSYTKAPIITDKDHAREFMGIYPDIIRELSENSLVSSSADSSKWISELMQYTVPNGNKSRGLTLVKTYKTLEKPERLTPESIRMAIIMGWCVEMFQAFHIITEDMIHGCQMRRGMPAWHLKSGVRAVNDTAMIQSIMYLTLRNHFQNQPYYLEVLHIFNDMIAKLSNGQLLEKLLFKDSKPDLSKFTMKQYDTIVKYKTCYFRYQMPVILAMKMCGITDTEMQRQATTVLLEIGQFFQIQRDYLDCFGDPQETGIIGTDIMNGRCSWLAVVALQRANQAQKQLMEQHFGTKNPEDTIKIKSLYEELGLKATYKTYEEKTNQTIVTHIQQLTRGLPHELFLSMMKNIYGRKS